MQNRDKKVIFLVKWVCAKKENGGAFVRTWSGTAGFRACQCAHKPISSEAERCMERAVRH